MPATLPSLDQMLDKLIATPSVSSVNPQLDTGNDDVNSTIAAWLETLGFDVDIQALPGQAGKSNLIATRGEGSDGLVFAGHTDTVPYDERGWSRSPFTAYRDGGRLYGLGSCDMKGFFALVIEALRDYHARDQKKPIAVVATADEESGMAGARALVERGYSPGRHVIIGEPTRGIPIRAHKGIFMLRIIVRGRSGHSSDPDFGRSALDGMLAVLNALKSLREELAARYQDSRFSVPTPTLNLGRIAGGDNPNRICAQCELDIDLRLTPGMDLDSARTWVKEKVLAALNGRGLSAEFVSLFDGVDPMDTRQDAAVVRACEAQTGHRAGVVSFATEAPLFAELGMSAVVLGPGDIAVAHQPDEYLELESLAPMVRHLRALYEQFCVQEARVA